MKKLIITSVCGLALTSSVFSQGNLRWDSIPFNAMTAVTNSQSYSPLFGGGSTGNGTIGATAVTATGFYYALLFTSFNGSQAAQPASVAALSSWTDSGLAANNATSTAGRLIPINPNAGAQVSWSPGTTNSIMLVGWSANLGTTWAAAFAKLQAPNSISGPGYFGESTTGYLTPLSTATSPGATVFGTAATAQGLPINSLNTPLFLIPVAPVPEPGTMALAAIGGASLLLFRRRK